MTALLVIDMQVESFRDPAEKHDPTGVVRRINELAAATRTSGGRVIFVQHDGPPGDEFEPNSEGWRLLTSLERDPRDPVVHKRACDAFYETGLRDEIRNAGENHLLVTGNATEFCVDTTLRAAASLDFDVTAVADAHTTSDRAHLDAAAIVQHHNWIWEELILPRRSVEVAPTKQIIAGLLGA